MADLTERARRAIQIAISEAQARGHQSVGTDHLLWALASQDGGPAIKLLHKHFDPTAYAQWLRPRLGEDQMGQVIDGEGWSVLGDADANEATG